MTGRSDCCYGVAAVAPIERKRIAMPRGRKPRAMTCQPPPRGVYLVDWTVNEMFRRGLIHGQALILWLHLKGLAWQRGECDPTDARLAALMGDIKPDLIRITRRTLEANNLLHEYQRDSVRWLVPLPVTSDQRANFPPEVWARLADRQGRLAARLEDDNPGRIPHEIGGEMNSPPLQLGARSIGSQLLKEEEELTRAQNNTPPRPLNGTTYERRAEERGGNRNGIRPHPNWGSEQMGLNSGGGELPGTADEGGTTDLETLVKFMTGHGVFPSIARTVAPQYLERMNLREAQADVLAWVISIRDSKDSRDGQVDPEKGRARLATRLREGAEPPVEALDHAWEILQEMWDHLEADPDRSEEEDAEYDEVDDEAQALPVDETESAGEAGDELAMPAWEVKVGDQTLVMDAEQVWSMVRSHLRVQLGASTYNTYVAASWCAGVEEVEGRSTMVVQVNHQFMADWLNHHRGVRQMIDRTLRSLLPQDLGIRFEEVY
jgi:hypothetical protein